MDRKGTSTSVKFPSEPGTGGGCCAPTSGKSVPCCGGGSASTGKIRYEDGFIEGMVDTPAGPVPRVHSRIGSRDILGRWKVRWGIGRDRYRVAPGLYALGAPDGNSPVLVTANYKLTFDAVRRDAAGADAWILVLDTQGINVWCAAGEGTFGTEEVIHRVAETRLPEIVRHRRLLLPQLGAPASPPTRSGRGATSRWCTVRSAAGISGRSSTPGWRRLRRCEGSISHEGPARPDADRDHESIAPRGMGCARPVPPLGLRAGDLFLGAAWSVGSVPCRPSRPGSWPAP